MAIPGASSRVVSLCLLIALGSRPAAAAECARPLAAQTSRAEPISLRLEGIAARTARSAIAMWGSCGRAGAGFPLFALDPPGTRVLTVRRAPTSGRAICGELRGSEIVLYAFALGAAGVVRCEGEAQTLAHELGHVLGLADAPVGAGCAGHIMAANPGPGGRSRAVRAEECGAVDQRWRTPRELSAELGLRVARL